MTAPLPASRPAEIIPRPPVLSPIHDVSPHCTAKACWSDDTVSADGVFGRRCALHPPEFSRAYLTHLLEHGWHDVALAYSRFDHGRPVEQAPLPAPPPPVVPAPTVDRLADVRDRISDVAVVCIDEIARAGR